MRIQSLACWLACAAGMSLLLPVGESAMATQQRVGRVVAPTAFAHIHYYRSPFDVMNEIKSVRTKISDLKSKALEKKAPSRVIKGISEIEDRFNGHIRPTIGKLKRLKELGDDIIDPDHRQKRNVDAVSEGVPDDFRADFDDLRVRAVHVDRAALKEEERALSREKRVAPLIVGGAIAVVTAGVVALGLGVANRVEVEMMKDKVEGVIETQDSIISSVEQLSLDIDHNFAQVNESINNLEWGIATELMEVDTRATIQDIEDKADGYLRGFYHLLQGKLDPSLVSLADLNRGLQQVAADAAPKGMRIVPFELPQEVLFTMPVSGIVNSSGVHIFVTVPIIPERAPVLELLHVEHAPIPLGNGTFLDIEMPKDYLAIDRERTQYIELSPAELSACPSHKDTYFCPHRTLQKKPHTCTAAVLHGDKQLAAKTCKTSVVKKPVLVLPVANSSFDMDVWATKEQTVVQVCPGIRDQPLQRFSGHRRVKLGPGCSLATDTTVTYHTDKVPDEDISVHVSGWDPRELLGDLRISHVQDYVDAMDLRDVRVDLGAIRAKQPRIFHYIGMGMSAFAIISLLALLGFIIIRIAILRRRRERATEVAVAYAPPRCMPPTYDQSVGHSVLELSAAESEAEAADVPQTSVEA